MCDTLIATAEATADGVTLFAKNSDREPNEAHQILLIPAATHPPGSTVRCTYIDIPQVEKTHTVLLSKPFWTWGAEMGANDAGVVIGNEAVFTKIPYDKQDGLTGMDLLRLALERSDGAQGALRAITGLIERHGQGGNCGFRSTLYYHNSFLIADPGDAWLLETAGRHWAARQVRGVYAISNGLTIGSEWDLASTDLVQYAVERGWCTGREDFHFARCYSDLLFTRFSDCRYRRTRAVDLLGSHRGTMTPLTMMDILRDHGMSPYRPDRGLTGSTLCMHAGAGPVRRSQTTGSLVSHLHSIHPIHFMTGTAAPCTGIFKPLWTDIPLPFSEPSPAGTYDPATLFWRHELLHRSALRDHERLTGLYRHDRDTLEQGFASKALTHAGDKGEIRDEFSRRCFIDAEEAEKKWLALLSGTPVFDRRNLLYRLAWKRFNKTAGMPEHR